MCLRSAPVEGGSEDDRVGDSIGRWAFSGDGAGWQSKARGGIRRISGPHGAGRSQQSRGTPSAPGIPLQRDRGPSRLRPYPPTSHAARPAPQLAGQARGVCAVLRAHRGHRRYRPAAAGDHPSAAWTWPPLWAGVQALCKSATPSSARPERDQGDTQRPKRQCIVAVEIQRLMQGPAKNRRAAPPQLDRTRSRHTGTARADRPP